jgi:hypothetical protein
MLKRGERGVRGMCTNSEKERKKEREKGIKGENQNERI